MATKTVKLTIVVQVHDEKALEEHVRSVAFGDYDWDDRTTGYVSNALINCDPAPLDYGIEIQSIKAEAVEENAINFPYQDGGRWPKGS